MRSLLNNLNQYLNSAHVKNSAKNEADNCANHRTVEQSLTDASTDSVIECRETSEQPSVESSAGLIPAYLFWKLQSQLLKLSHRLRRQQFKSNDRNR